jgi:uncharacterized RDD family membrane protein YckC
LRAGVKWPDDVAVRCRSVPASEGNTHVSQPPGPPNPYGGPPQQPYGQPQYGQPGQPQYGQPQQQQQPGIPQQPAYGQPAGYGYPPQQPYGGYGIPGGVPGGVPGALPYGMPPLASWGARLGALILDLLMFNLIPTGIFQAGYLSYSKKVSDAVNACADRGISRGNCQDLPTATNTQITLMVVGGLLGLAVAIFLVYREGRTGQTPGKKIVGIRVLRERDGAALGFWRAFGRRLLHILDGIPCFLGYLWPLWDDKNQTFADKIVKSVVIKDQF